MVLGFGMYHFYLSNHTNIPKERNVSYYDALILKSFNRAHAYLNPDSNVGIAQYMLEVFRNGWYLSFICQIRFIGVELFNETQTAARAKVLTHWVTPLEKIEKLYEHDLVKKNGKWYINPDTFDNDLPPDQLLSSNGTSFFNHGRDNTNTTEPIHEDVLKQPTLEILTAIGKEQR
ncbi:hypothetical protein Q2T40_01500 [Winogradskyella maritima]|nr:hypothetical protein [Winogradskyella maritima]